MKVIQKKNKAKSITTNFTIKVGKLKDSHAYFLDFKKNYPTYKNIVSDYLVK